MALQDEENMMLEEIQNRKRLLVQFSSVRARPEMEFQHFVRGWIKEIEILPGS